MFFGRHFYDRRPGGDVTARRPRREYCRNPAGHGNGRLAWLDGSKALW
ncbi:hypothetical protein Rhow_006286 [Rhodococcus wratislaviensis]|uniref:Uncharacterized protein n=1 Tax=Rhodococcus wratislaviensis TaxID=44752 RepID=A0A402CFL6_RHOWR|nr:hypothetical protein Rhow_006286 [Rhodococcus wratislaviensis]